MSKFKSAIIFVLSVGFVLFSVIQCKSQESEIEKFIKEVSIDSQKGAIFSYTYLMKISYQQHKKLGGRKFTRLYEAILPSRHSLNRQFSHPLILLRDSEKMISNDRIMDARKEIAKELEKAENEEDTPPTDKEKLKEDGGYWTIGFSANAQKIKVNVLQLLRSSRLSNLQRKQIDGRNTVLIEFAPNPNSVFEKSLSYLSKIEGQIWIDETAKRIIRVEGFAPGLFIKQREKPDSERQKEAAFLFLQTKVAEGFWFPQTVRLNFANHPEIFETVEVEFDFSNYKKASVDVKDILDAPKTTTSTSKEQ